ncbi:hypothetical protein CIK06_15285 [Plantactinospora sp. KBS50]|nr:hypothetical protein CIK06_15285 [Plantactinospora sp. KBS50]
MATGTPSRTGSPAPVRTDTLGIELWYVRDGLLEPTRHVRPVTQATSRLTLNELATGPNPAEAAAGLSSDVPPDIEIDGIDDGVETLVVGPGFEAGGTTAVRLRQAQIVYSLTQFPSVERVVFRRTGRPDPAALGRADLADLLPPIVVTAPGVGAAVPNPVTVAGTADVFEATVNIRILDSAGRTVATGFTMASCGSGCRGGYRTTLGYRVDSDQPGRIEVFEVSVRDGRRVNLVSRPVWLTR